MPDKTRCELWFACAPYIVWSGENRYRRVQLCSKSVQKPRFKSKIYCNKLKNRCARTAQNIFVELFKLARTYATSVSRRASISACATADQKTMSLMWLCSKVIYTYESIMWHCSLFLAYTFFLYMTLHCYAIVYRYSRGKSRVTLLTYEVPSPITVRKVGNLPSSVTLLARFAFTTTEPDSPSLLSWPRNPQHK